MCYHTNTRRCKPKEPAVTRVPIHFSGETLCFSRPWQTGKPRGGCPHGRGGRSIGEPPTVVSAGAGEPKPAKSRLFVAVVLEVAGDFSPQPLTNSFGKTTAYRENRTENY